MVSIFLTASRLIHVINTWTLLIKGGNELGPSCETLWNGVSMVQINAFSTASTPPDPLQEQLDRFLVDASPGDLVVAEVAHLHAHCLTTPPLTEFWSTSALQDCLLYYLDTAYCLQMWPLYGPHIFQKFEGCGQKQCALWGGIFAESRIGFRWDVIFFKCSIACLIHFVTLLLLVRVTLC